MCKTAFMDSTISSNDKEKLLEFSTSSIAGILISKLGLDNFTDETLKSIVTCSYRCEKKNRIAKTFDAVLKSELSKILIFNSNITQMTILNEFISSHADGVSSSALQVYGMTEELPLNGIKKFLMRKNDKTEISNLRKIAKGQFWESTFYDCLPKLLKEALKNRVIDPLEEQMGMRRTKGFFHKMLT